MKPLIALAIVSAQTFSGEIPVTQGMATYTCMTVEGQPDKIDCVVTIPIAPPMEMPNAHKRKQVPNKEERLERQLLPPKDGESTGKKTLRYQGAYPRLGI